MQQIRLTGWGWWEDLWAISTPEIQGHLPSRAVTSTTSGSSSRRAKRIWEEHLQDSWTLILFGVLVVTFRAYEVKVCFRHKILRNGCLCQEHGKKYRYDNFHGLTNVHSIKVRRLAYSGAFIWAYFLNYQPRFFHSLKYWSSKSILLDYLFPH